ncbi:tubulin alpha-3 chain [Reticulomyxa filosa]|uniref:Tubulin alpha-3 chain n=1 Tax=Reticulomyxa filosa TaxID=46433 RepID=X6MNM1_RETFI|nr:tubulin alpha-3 chain [Reticulomyxa filosa]|eukprot:ETO15027.1 tubulin alpha-3 chain [Reticulomyxa filosa]
MSCLVTHWLLDHTKGSLLLDNEAIYGICQKQLKIAKPDVDNLNKLISKVIPAMTVSLRFSGELKQIGLNEVQAVTLESDDIGAFSKNFVMIANNTGISRVFSKQLPKSMILCTPNEHWYVGEGMEGEFAEARED